jgi:hypothetical protein
MGASLRQAASEAPNGAMPPAVQALGVAVHIKSEPEADPVALAYEMIILLRSVRFPAAR